MPVPQHSIFYRPGALPDAQPTVSDHWMQKNLKWCKKNYWCKRTYVGHHAGGIKIVIIAVYSCSHMEHWHWRRWCTIGLCSGHRSRVAHGWSSHARRIGLCSRHRSRVAHGRSSHARRIGLCCGHRSRVAHGWSSHARRIGLCCGHRSRVAQWCCRVTPRCHRSWRAQHGTTYWRWTNERCSIRTSHRWMVRRDWADWILLWTWLGQWHVPHAVFHAWTTSAYDSQSKLNSYEEWSSTQNTGWLTIHYLCTSDRQVLTTDQLSRKGNIPLFASKVLFHHANTVLNNGLTPYS